MANATEQKFGDPANRVAQSQYWTVLVRPRQPALGSLVLVCREEARAFGSVSPAAFADLAHMVQGVESMLSEVVAYERINYLMLMMVDPDVHFHVIPRYHGLRSFAAAEFPDSGWPGPPALEPAVALTPTQRDALVQRLRQAWTGEGRAS